MVKLVVYRILIAFLLSTIVFMGFSASASIYCLIDQAHCDGMEATIRFALEVATTCIICGATLGLCYTIHEIVRRGFSGFTGDVAADRGRMLADEDEGDMVATVAMMRSDRQPHGPFFLPFSPIIFAYLFIYVSIRPSWTQLDRRPKMLSDPGSCQC